MKKKLRNLLSESCKDMGLTDKALDELTELGAKGLTDESSDEDLQKAVDLLTPYAKAMQAEITRKTRKGNKAQSTEQQSNGEGEGEGENKNDVVPDWFKPFQEKMTALENENATLKEEKAKTARQNEIAEKAKKLGIPDYLMKRVSFADDADLDKELADYKQELVTNQLLPKTAEEKGAPEEAMKADAKAWAASLPDL